MARSVTIKKHNTLTDGQTTYSLTAEKLLNAVYHTWIREGVDTFTVPIADLKELIGYNNNDNDFLYDCLKELQAVQRFRNFEYKGRGIKLLQSSFIMDLTVYQDNYNFAQMTINPKIVEALKVKAGYTPLELKIVEKFRTVGGYKLYQLFRRYEFLPNRKDNQMGEITFSVEELNSVLGTKYIYLSDIEKVVKRGLNEIKKIAELEIYHLPKKKEKEITFCWRRKSPYLQTISTFMAHMRQYFVNKIIYSYSSVFPNESRTEISISADGLLYYYSKPNQPFLNKEDAKLLWKNLYKYAQADKLYCLKQGSLF